jgi:hypothetical protein
MAVTNPFDQKRGYQFGVEIDGEIRPLKNSIIVTEMSFEGRQLSSGILLLGDDGKTTVGKSVRNWTRTTRCSGRTMGAC